MQNSNDDSIKVFILARGSNMVGKGVVEPNRTQYYKNGGQGSLRFLVDDETQKYKYGHLEDESRQWSEQ